MAFLNNLKIGIKLPLVMVLIGAVSLVLAGFIASSHTRESVLVAGQDRLMAVAESRAAEMEGELQGVRADLQAKVANPVILEAARAFVTAFELYGPAATEDLRRLYVTENSNPKDFRNRLVNAGDGSGYSLVHRRYHRFFAAYATSFGYADIYIVSPDGRIVYSVTKSEDFMAKIGTDGGTDTRMSHLYRATMRTPADISDRMTDFDGHGDGLSALFSIPIRSPQGTLEAILIFRLSTGILDQIMQRPEGLGRTGEAFVIGSDRRLRTALRGAASAIVRLNGRDSPAVAQAFANRRGVVRHTDDKGKGVVTAYVPIFFQGLQFAVMAQQSEDEILVSAQRLHKRMLQDGVFALYLVSIVGLIIARSMSVPLVRVGEVMKRVALRDFEGTIPDRKRRDEIGGIARQLDAFRASLAASDGLERENAFKSAAFQATSAALMLADRNLTIIYVNQSLINLMKENSIAIDRQVPDFRPDALPGRNVTSFFPGAFRSKSRDGVSAHFQEEIKLGQRHMRIGMGPILDIDGEVLGYVIEWEDSTQARLNKAVLDTIDRHMPIAGFSPDGRLIDANSQFEEWVGSSKAELLGRSWDWLFVHETPADAGRSKTARWADVARSEDDRGRLLELCPVLDDGPPMPVCMNAVRDEHGSLQRYVLLAPGQVFGGLRPAIGTKLRPMVQQ